MKVKKLIIYGVGRFAEYAGYVFNMDSKYSVEVFTMEESYLQTKKNTSECHKVEIFTTIEEKYKPIDYDLFIAVGNNIIRERIFNLAKQKGYKLATYVSSKAFFWDNLIIGENCFIGEGSVLQPFTKIGNNSILFNASIGHHCEIGDHTLLSSCLLGGNVRIGRYSFLGLHSTVKENTIIAERNLLGMGVTIMQDTQPNSIYSNQASKKRNLSFSDFYRNYID